MTSLGFVTSWLCITALGVAEEPPRGRVESAQRLQAARTLRQAGDADGAERELRALLEAAPAHIAGRLALAEILADRAQWAAVVDTLRSVSGTAAGYPLYHLRGRALLEGGRLDLARRSLRRALGHKPESAPDLYLLARVHATAKRWALAVKTYHRARRAGLDDAALHLGLARAYFHRAVCLGTVKVKTLPDAKPGHIVANAYVLEPVPKRRDTFRVCPPDSAIFHLAAARHRGAAGPDVDLLEADIWLESKRFARARALYAGLEAGISARTAAAFFDRFSRAHLGLADFDRAIRLLQRAAKLDAKTYAPKLAAAHLAAADHAALAADAKRAVYHLAQAVAVQPDAAPLHRRLADAYAEQNEPQKAAQHWRRVLVLDPDASDREALLQQIHDASARRP